jgi:Leucine-rich repeat (LRR) protein
MFFCAFLITVLKIHEQCELEDEMCSCLDTNSFGKIQMNCLRKKIDYRGPNKSITLSFETLKGIPLNVTNIALKIQYKFISQMDASTSQATIFTRRVTSLTLQNCKIAHILPNSFSTLISLEELYLNMNEISSLAENFFKGIETTLKKLELHSNKIKSFSRQLLSGLASLNYLDLRVNDLSSFNCEQMTSNLQTLYLTSNKLKLVRREFFVNLKGLNLLGLSGNEIDHMDIDSFNETSLLKTLYLSSNKISEIKRGHFGNLKRLEILWLHRNEICLIERGSFEDALTLRILYLSLNKLKFIQRGQFDHLPSLTSLHLFQNEIVNIEEDSFEHMPLLNELNLCGNKISKIRVSNISQLTHLNLSHNFLVSLVLANLSRLVSLDLTHNYLDGFVEGIFEGLTLLGDTNVFLEFNLIQRLSKRCLKGFFFKVLSLKNNGLKFIEDFSFENSFSLETLFLDSNYLSQMSGMSLANLTHLKQLFLSSNRINSLGCIGHSLTHLSNLESIDLSLNSIEFINENDFNFSARLTSINLSGNRIRKIHLHAFRDLSLLSTFQFAQIEIESNFESLFDVSVYFHENVTLTSLDLSFTRIEMSDQVYFKCFRDIKSLTLNRVLFLSKSLLNFGVFLSKKIEYLDLGGNLLKRETLRLLGTMRNLQRLYLMRTNLQSLKSINFTQLMSLANLDVSFNFLSELDWRMFRAISRLEYLNLNNNRISFVDPRMFNVFESNKINQLKFLYMENNQIVSLDGVKFTNYLDLKG